MYGSVKILKGRRAALLALAGLCVASLNLFTAEASRPARAERAPAAVAAPPRANGKIAFTSGRDTDGLDIYVMNPDGTGLARLTDGRSYNVDAAWSPDGRTLAFVSNRGGGSFAIYLMSADGANVRRLTDSAEDEGTPAWSPDGAKIAFARGLVGCIPEATCPGPDLYVIDADGKNEKRLTEGRVGDSSPSWSPDGTKIAFSSLRDGNAEVYVMNPDGTGQVNVTKDAQSYDYGPAWSPDGAKIAFTSDRAGRFDIYVMNADGTGRTNLTNNTTNEIIEHPAWSPDGTRIVFARYLLINGGQGENRDLFVMNADGSNQTRLTFDPDFDVEPDWQPVPLAANGRVLFTSGRDGNPEVYSMNGDGGGQTNLTSTPARDFNPVWSPDGTKVLFASDRGGGTFQRVQFYVMNADGTGVTQITNFPDGTDVDFSEPAWSPDATKIAFISTSFGAIHNLMVMNTDGTGGKSIASMRGLASDVDPAWSPDGTRLAYVGTEDVSGGPGVSLRSFLFVINADGTGKTKLADAMFATPTGPTTSVGGPSWSPDGTRIAYGSNRGSTNVEIYTVGSSGGAPVRLTDNAARDYLPSWSPDGRKIAFTSDRDGNSEIYSMNADGTGQTRLTNNPAPDQDPDWGSAGARPPLPASPGTVQFDSFLYGVSEGTPVLTVTVTRLGDLSGEAAVDYTTGDICDLVVGPTCNGIASSRSDYQAALGRLHFAPGESSKSFDVHVVNDLTVEGDESFSVELKGAVGAALGGQARAGVFIFDDDTAAPSGNPIDGTQFFVRQHYLDFLNREPDADGFNFWVNEIEKCGADAQCREVKRVNVSAAFFLSIESRETGYLVYRTYKAAYGDATSPNVPGTVPVIRLNEFLEDTQEVGRGLVVGRPNWEQTLEANKTAFMSGFVQRQRFTGAFPLSMTAAQFVGRLDQNAGGVLTTDERAALVARLSPNPADTAARASVLRSVAESRVLRDAEFNRAFVLTQYFGYLRRNPNDPPDSDFRGWKFWLDKLNQFGGNYVEAEMVKAFITSTEYRRRFGQ
ncbi:MAG: PD40 domain-containing protein [Acidobacteria bacterium]|nr:PD40 domain-containing protein [Acidobacteriota bacterium]